MTMSKTSQSGEGERTTRALVNFAEEHAVLLRQRAGVRPRDRLDPRALVDELKLVIVEPSNVTKATVEDYALVTKADVKAWSGMGKRLPNGCLLVMLHPSQTPKRANVTIMEEVAHAHLGHRPSQLILHPNGLEKRAYNEKDEDDAYWTAAATLLPRDVVVHAVWQRQRVTEFAAAYGASPECAEFRIKTLGLWSAYKTYSGRGRRAS